MIRSQFPLRNKLLRWLIYVSRKILAHSSHCLLKHSLQHRFEIPSQGLQSFRSPHCHLHHSNNPLGSWLLHPRSSKKPDPRPAKSQLGRRRAWHLHGGSRNRLHLSLPHRMEHQYRIAHCPHTRCRRPPLNRHSLVPGKYLCPSIHRHSRKPHRRRDPPDRKMRECIE